MTSTWPDCPSTVGSGGGRAGGAWGGCCGEGGVWGSSGIMKGYRVAPVTCVLTRVPNTPDLTVNAPVTFARIYTD